MSNRSRPLPLLFSFSNAALLALVALVGCKQDPGPSSASIDFVLGNDKECAEVGVETIHVVLSRGEGADRVELYEEYAPCVDGPVIVEDITPKNYDLLVEGLDDAMIVVFDNLGSPASERKIEIFDGSQAQTTVDLTARPSDLLVRWRLGEDGFGNCAGVGIDRFDVRAFETGGGTLLLEHSFDCETTGEGTEGYRLVPDPERVLNGTRLGEVGIQALDASGTEVGEPATFVFDPVGPGYPTKLTLECSNVGCTGSGTTD